MSLPNRVGTGKRAAVERALHLWIQRGVLFYAGTDPDDPGRYRATTGDGTVWQGLTLKEARLLVHGCASGWEGARRAQQEEMP